MERGQQGGDLGNSILTHETAAFIGWCEVSGFKEQKGGQCG